MRDVVKQKIGLKIGWQDGSTRSSLYLAQQVPDSSRGSSLSREKEYPERNGGVGGRGGGRRRLDARRPSNMAPIATKLCLNAFWTISINSIFGEQIFLRRDFSVSEIVLHLFGSVLEDLRRNRPQWRLPRNVSL